MPALQKWLYRARMAVGQYVFSRAADVKGYKVMNADLNARIGLDTEAMAWLATDGARGDCKQLDRVDA
ncbi:MAG: hypothetical protein ABT23_08375 [Thiobacillus sp. SCN 63-57]|nr:MAG: hypothetical protein ABT23_08375 [Thiobacillus sp. SCN 63-57]